MKKILFALSILVVLFFVACPTGIIPNFSLSVSFDSTVFDASSNTLDFGLAEVDGQGITLQGRLRNDGDTPIIVDSMTVDDNLSYTIASGLVFPFSMEPGQPTTFSLTFNPSSSGIKPASLVIGFTTDSKRKITVYLKGEGNSSPSAQFGIDVSGATDYPEIEGFYVKDSTFNSRPTYIKSGSPAYYIYFFQPDGDFWGIDSSFNTDYPWYDTTNKIAYGSIAYLGPMSSADADTFQYPPETEGGTSWIENSATSSQITFKTGITGKVDDLIANYHYSDADGDAEGTTSFRWLRSATLNGSYSEMAGETGSTYTLDMANDQGIYFKVEVTPVDSNGFKGSSVLSDPYYIEVLQAQ